LVAELNKIADEDARLIAAGERLPEGIPEQETEPVLAG
jgi:hypothetical protein